MYVQLSASASADIVLARACRTLGIPVLGGGTEAGWSRKADLQRCPYRFFLKYVAEAAPVGTGADRGQAMDIGSYTHAALGLHYARALPSALYPGYIENAPDPDLLLTTALDCGGSALSIQGARMLYEGYIEHYGVDIFAPTAVEMLVGDPNLHTARYDLVAYVDEGFYPGLWIVEHKTMSQQSDMDIWANHGEILGEMLAWRLDNLEATFGAPLAGVCINMLIKGKVPRFQREWIPLKHDVVRVFEKDQQHWQKIRELYQKSKYWPRAQYGCLSRYEKCCFWEHCSTMDSNLLIPVELASVPEELNAE